MLGRRTKESRRGGKAFNSREERAFRLSLPSLPLFLLFDVAVTLLRCTPPTLPSPPTLPCTFKLQECCVPPPSHPSHRRPRPPFVSAAPSPECTKVYVSLAFPFRCSRSGGDSCESTRPGGAGARIRSEELSGFAFQFIS